MQYILLKLFYQHNVKYTFHLSYDSRLSFPETPDVRHYMIEYIVFTWGGLECHISGYSKVSWNTELNL